MRYKATIQNTGTDVTGVTFTATLDALTTMNAGTFKTSPVAFPDAYSSIGNVGIVVNAANGLEANDYQNSKLKILRGYFTVGVTWIVFNSKISRLQRC
jgi:trimeric autotransporter adhesin